MVTGFEEITADYAEGLDALREALGPKGVLTALHFSGQDEAGNSVYAPLKTFSGGWGVKTSKGDDGAFFTRITIADTDSTLAALIDDVEQGVTDFAFGGRIYKLEPDETTRPVRAPFVWQFRTQVNTKDVYPPPEP